MPQQSPAWHGMACLQNHFLESLGLTMDNGWACDGIKGPSGCRSGLSGFNQSQGRTKRLMCVAGSRRGFGRHDLPILLL